jgi:phosphoribosylformimino-5-aminoimidazole carboxamide ribotide isomerase
MQGRKSDVTVYNENPVQVAKEFASAGAQMIHVVDLDGAFSEADSPNRAVVQKILEAVDVPVEFGGGIRSLDDVQTLSDQGVARVVLGTIAAEAPDSLNEFVERFSSKICVGIDARDGRVMSRGWETSTPVDAIELARSVAARGVERIIYTVTASGGVSSLDDIKRLRDADDPRLDSVIVGKALYEGKFKLEEAINAAT